jgi:hypothetical protein
MQPGFQQNISQKLCHEGAFVLKWTFSGIMAFLMFLKQN